MSSIFYYTFCRKNLILFSYKSHHLVSSLQDIVTNSELPIPTHFHQITAVSDFPDLYHNLLVTFSQWVLFFFSNSSSSLTSSDIIVILLIYCVDIDGLDCTESLRRVRTIRNWQKIMTFLFCPQFLIVLKIILPVFDTY